MGFKKGNEAILAATTEKVSLKDRFINLKAGESIKVRIMSAEDIVSYKAHSAFDLKIFTQPCIADEGECPFCKASKANEGEAFDNLYARERFVLAFACLDTGDIRAFETNKKTAAALISTITEYKDELDSVYFTLKRSGSGASTTYSLNPSLKFKGNERELFDEFNGKVIEDSFYEEVLPKRTPEQMQQALYTAGFPSEKHFKGFVPAVFNEVPSVEVQATTDDTIPF